MINVFIIGSKGIPAKYGGFETFVEKLTFNKKSEDIKYFVSCMSSGEVFEHNNATCFPIEIKKDSAFNRMKNVHNALRWVENHLEQHSNKADKNIVYILGCRVGLLIHSHKKKLHKLGCKIVCNPDGLEWKRDKWNGIQKKIVLCSERKLIKNSDYVICDSQGIRDYILKTYTFLKPDVVDYIAYGSDISKSTSSDEEARKYLEKFGCKPQEYYLVVGRFVSENNFDVMIREFMASHTKKKLLLITNYDRNDLYKKLNDTLHFENDERIVFAGTLYDEELLKKIRELSYGYIHGHSVGGTNPSLLEALSYTKINILFNVSFNKEVGRDQCLYFTSVPGDLSKTIDGLDINGNYKGYVDRFNSRKIIEQDFSWNKIVDEYESVFHSLVL